MPIINSKVRPTGVKGVRSFRSTPEGTYEVHLSQGADVIKVARELGVIEKRQNMVTVGDLLKVLRTADPDLIIGYRDDYHTVPAKRIVLDEEHLVLS